MLPSPSFEELQGFSNAAISFAAVRQMKKSTMDQEACREASLARVLSYFMLEPTAR